MTDFQVPVEPVRPKPYGIGGWLILPVIGVCITPIRGLLSAAQYSNLASTYEFLSTGQLTFVVCEILVNTLLLILVPLYLLYLLLKKKQRFPKVYVYWGIASFAFIIIDLLIAAIVFRDVFSQAETPLLDADTVKEVLRSVVLVAIWVPYMLISRRVANTFTQ